jgi:hypothetical protein
MGYTISEEGEIALAGISGKNILENVGNLPNSNNVFLTPGGKPNLNCYVVNMDVEGNEKIPGGSIFPNP